MDSRDVSPSVNEQQQLPPPLPSSPPPNLETMILDGSISSKSLAVIKFLLSKDPYLSDRSLQELLNSDEDITERLSEYFSRLMELRRYLPYEDTLKLGLSKLGAPIPQGSYYLSLVDDDRNDIRAVMMAYLSLVLSSKASFFDQRVGEKKSVRQYALSELANTIEKWFLDKLYDRLAAKLCAAARNECWNTPAEFYQAMAMSEEGIRWDDYLVSALQEFLKGFPSVVTEESEGCIVTDKIKTILLGCRMTFHRINAESGQPHVWKRTSMNEYGGVPECGFAIDIHLLCDQEDNHYDIYYTKMIAPGMVGYLTQLNHFYYPSHEEMLALKASSVYLDHALINQFFDELGQPAPSEGIFSAIVSHFAKKPDAAVRTAFYDRVLSAYNNQQPYTQVSFIKLLDDVCVQIMRDPNFSIYANDKGTLMRAVFPNGDKAKETLRQILGAESLDDIIKQFSQKFSIQMPIRK